MAPQTSVFGSAYATVAVIAADEHGANLYLNFRPLYYRHERFESYKLFSVGASERISQPKIPDGAEKSLPPKS